MNNQKKILLVMALVAIMAAMFTLTRGGDTSPKTPAKERLFSVDALAPFDEQILRVGNGSEPKGLDPAKITGVPEAHIVSNLFEGLVSHDPVTLASIPGVAESWTISDDAKVYTFKIRKDSKWSDGTALTAKDFQFSWIRALDPMTASEYAYQLYYIKNGESFNTGKIKDPSQLGIKVLDPYTLEVTLENPTPFFLRLCAFQSNT